MFTFFMSKNEFAKLNVAKMEKGYSVSSGANIKSITSVVMDKINASKVQDYEQILMFLYKLRILGCEVLMMGTL